MQSEARHGTTSDGFDTAVSVLCSGETASCSADTSALASASHGASWLGRWVCMLLRARCFGLLQVGNSMNLFRTSNGAAIDRHEAVMRFNNEWERMQHVMREAGTLRPDTQAQHLGFKTTFRLLNRKYTNQVR
jgi:hypothetical protein